jgi:hypothetical protein
MMRWAGYVALLEEMKSCMKNFGVEREDLGCGFLDYDVCSLVVYVNTPAVNHGVLKLCSKMLVQLLYFVWKGHSVVMNVYF